MGLINMFRSSGEAAPADPRDETVINGAQYHAHPPAARSGHVPGQDAEIPEEIKQRQISLAVRYVISMRAR
jgi:hypothetical protein